MKKIILFGSWAFFTWLWLGSALQAQTGWVYGEALNDPRGHGAGAVVNGKVYFIGGAYSATWTSDKLEVYDPADRTWTVKASLPFPLLNATAQAISGKIYVAGGHDTYGSTSKNTLLVYDPATNSWASKALMPTARGSAASAVVEGKLYVIGGSTSTGLLKKMEMYDPETNQWTEKASMPIARAGFRAEMIQGKIYAIGGVGEGSFLSSMDIYDPVSNTWIAGPGLPQPRYWYGSVAMDTVIYVFGGAKDDVNTIETTLRYSPDIGWADLNLKLPEYKIWGISALAGNILYFIGGSLYPFYFPGMAGPKVTGSMLRCELTPVATQDQFASADATLSVMPNPSNGQTTICYELKTGVRIDLRIVDLMGQEVDCLARGFHPPGTYTVDWNAHDLPAGAYWCRLQVNGQKDVKHILLIR